MIPPQNVKILAPAGSYESLMSAIQAGADAVYFGVSQLNMRAVAAVNFDVHDLANISRTCKEHGVKSCLTLNTILYEHDLPLMRKLIDAAKAQGVDAVIATDLAAITYAREIGQPVHLSTMQSISNYEAVKFFAQFADVIVLAREVTLPMVKRIHERMLAEDLRGPSGAPVQLEAFAHGALCIAVSGKCFMSLHNHNASAARGACRQECRRAYKITDLEDGTEMELRENYVMSPADLCTIDILPRLLDAGISILKIEGRGRPPEYVDTVTRCYKEAAAAIAEGTYTDERVAVWKERLAKVYNRGFSNGYYLGQRAGFWAQSSHNQAKEERIHAGTVTNYFQKPGVAEITLEAHGLKEGENIIVTGKTTGLVRAQVIGMRLEDTELASADKGKAITMKLETPVRRGDKVYLLSPRQSS